MVPDNVEGEKVEEKQPRVEFNFPMLIVRTKRFAGVFDKLGSFRLHVIFRGWELFLCPLLPELHSTF